MNYTILWRRSQIYTENLNTSILIPYFYIQKCEQILITGGEMKRVLKLQVVRLNYPYSTLQIIINVLLNEGCVTFHLYGHIFIRTIITIILSGF